MTVKGLRSSWHNSRICEVIGSTAAPNRTMTSLYALGWTQHTTGSQNIRAMACIQLLLGNMGMPGGGVNALRGESNVQGSTDMGLLAHLPLDPHANLRTAVAAEHGPVLHQGHGKAEPSRADRRAAPRDAPAHHHQVVRAAVSPVLGHFPAPLRWSTTVCASWPRPTTPTA